MRLASEFNAIITSMPLIANKQFYYMTEIPSTEFLLNEDFMKKIIGIYKSGFALNKFLSKAIS